MSAAALPETQDLTLQIVEKTNSNVELAHSMQVTSPETRKVAVEFLKGIKELREEAERHHRPMIEKAHAAHKEAVAMLKRVDDPLSQAFTLVKGRVGSYDIELQRQREEAERKAREEAERIAREERERQMREQQEREAAAQRERDEKALKAAESALAEGATESEAAAVMAEELAVPIAVEPPPVVVPAYVPPPMPKIEKQGVGTRVNYKARVKDFAALVKFVADNPMFINLLKVDESALGALAKAQRESFAIPGCELVRDTVVSVR